MNKYLLLGVFFVVILLVGVGVIITSEHVSFNDFLRSLSELSPSILGVIALPFIALVFVLGIYLRKKIEERKWKQALLRTRAERAKKN